MEDKERQKSIYRSLLRQCAKEKHYKTIPMDDRTIVQNRKHSQFTKYLDLLKVRFFLTLPFQL